MLVFGIVLSVLASSSVLGQDGWVRGGAEWYLVSPDRMTWFEAQEVCNTAHASHENRNTKNITHHSSFAGPMAASLRSFSLMRKRNTLTGFLIRATSTGLD